MSQMPGNADVRGFPWRLAALERKLDHDLDRARSALAALQREAANLDTMRHEMADGQAAQMRHASALVARRLDPVAHRACLQYLVLAEQSLQQRRSEAERLAVRVADARKACLVADRKLASLRSLRREDETGYATEQARRNARDADLAWLANAAAARATARCEGKAP
jgi:chromosome segregation ATPase